VHHRDGQVEQEVADERAADRRDDADEDRGHPRHPGREGLRRADGAEQADGERVEGGDDDVEAGEDPLEQHAAEGRRDRDEHEPVAGERRGRDVEEHVAEEAAAEARRRADDGDAEQVEAAVAEARREHGALEAADADRQEVRPERDGEGDGIHGLPLIAQGGRRTRPRDAGRTGPAPRGGGGGAGARGG
jgi:hypothetical protein